MKYLALLSLVIGALHLSAADRIVEEFGMPPAFPSIGAAVAAAEDGDRIIIKNRAGNIPWIENITIDKSLQFLSYYNDEFFIVQGDYIVEFITGLEVVIIGMRNTNGRIGQGSAASGNRAAKVSLIDSWLQNGGFSLTSNFFEAQVIGNKIENGQVRLAIGNLIGNDISGTNLASSLVWINNNTSTFLGDTCNIVGNRLYYVTSGMDSYCLRVRNNQQVVHIKNNYIQYSTHGLNINQGISEPIQNLVWNNTFHGLSSFSTSSSYGIRLFGTSSNSIWEVMNNVCVRGGLNMSTRHGISVSSPGGQANAYYNHVTSGFTHPITGAWTFEDLNQINQTIELNVEDGTFANVPNAINGGNPAPLFYDLDLSPNDAGAYGGSYTLDNFFPQHTGSARIGFPTYYFNVRDGNTLRVKAMSFDR